MTDPLPIDIVLPTLVTAVLDHHRAVVVAPPGSGKTTRVPPGLAAAGIDGRIFVLEPRRIAARAAARRMAWERGEQVGESVGYQVRFDRKVGPRTQIVVETEGIFLRMLQADPFLEGVGAVVFDEFHERSLSSDLALAMTRTIQREVREDLSVVVMSATLEAGPVAAFLGDAPIIEATGHSHPVETIYLKASARAHLLETVVRTIPRALTRTSGDVLVFLPGVGEVRRVSAALAPMAHVTVYPLHGGLSPARQDAALRRGPGRKVVLATNVAETSVTVDGVTAVIDAGLARKPSRDPRTGLTRLLTGRISVASADQRRGRAGRQGPGHCYRLWTPSEERALDAFDASEVARIDLDGAVLQLMEWGEGDPRAFEWFEVPPEAALDGALELLKSLGAVGDAGVTELGSRMVQLPLEPRLAALVLESARLGAVSDGAAVAALLSDRDPFFDRQRGRRRLDLSERLDRLDALDRGGPDPSGLNVPLVRRILRARRQIVKAVGKLDTERPRVPRTEALARAVVAGFPDRVARQTDRDERGVRAVLAGGRGVKLGPELAANVGELFVCVALDGADRRDGAWARAEQVLALDRRWLPAAQIASRRRSFFDPGGERVVTEVNEVYGGGLILSRVEVRSDPAEAARLLAEAAARMPERALPLNDPTVQALLARVGSLRQWIPTLDLPDLDPTTAPHLLAALADGCRSFAELRDGARAASILSAQLTWKQRQSLDTLAPERLEVPSGSKIALHYEVGRPPVLAVRIQEVFGLTATPTVAAGRVRVLLHLLAPNMRPQQVTDDLPSFWRETYSEVRRELRRRYPKHAWPEDPIGASPERRPRRRRPR